MGCIVNCNFFLLKLYTSSIKSQVLYNAQLLDWHPGQTGADVLFVDYENVESVELKDMYTKYR